VKQKELITVALVGNPNCGKSTLFNALTGLNQKTGNFPGVTVEKRVGKVRIVNHQLKNKQTFNFIDLPGTYSLFPKSLDELETLKVLTESNNVDYPDIVIAVADATNLKRSLLLCLQVKELGLPVLLILNMFDLLERSKLNIDIEKLSEALQIPVIAMNAREKKGISLLKNELFKIESNSLKNNNYSDFLKSLNNNLTFSLENSNIESNVLQEKEMLRLYEIIDSKINVSFINGKQTEALSLSVKLDKIFIHPVWGFLVFLSILFFIFQAIFSWSERPMDFIDQLFSQFGNFINQTLPHGAFNDLVSKGVIPGLGGIMMFIPQIAILFAFIAILEDTGYMARVTYIMDRLMRGFGLNGKSIIPLISGVACAVPAIMSARTIKNQKERLITILVTPLMSCSARLPVYTLLISVAVPDQQLGPFNLKGFLLMFLYLIGFLAAIITALVLKWLIKSKEKSYFIMELPVYRKPQWGVVAYTMFDKVRVFVFDAGKVIIAISIILWLLSSYGPSDKFKEIETKYTSAEYIQKVGKSQSQINLDAAKLRNSYAGIMGRTIEPIIAPLGFDWKIGIALVTSFAAREVFVGTMATIYSAGSGVDENSVTLKESMKRDVNENTGLPLFTFASALALILFYAFAMQCMSTLAVVFRETRSWRWPIFQFFYMGALAWIAAFVAYNLFK
jgi:ferrous iron transport protein B